MGEHGKSYPALKALIDSSEALSASKDLNAVLLLAEPFQGFLHSRELHELIADDIAKFKANDRYVPPGANGNLIFVFENEHVLMCLSLLRPADIEKSKIYGLASTALIGNAGPQPFSLRRFAYPPNYVNDDFDRTIRLSEVPRVTITQGEMVALPVLQGAMQYSLVAPSMILKLSAKTAPPTVWAFDAETLSALMSAASSPSASRLQTAAQIMSECEYEDERTRDESIERVLALCQHEAHFVRWSALQSLCALDLDIAYPILCQAEGDPHPAIRRNARFALSELRTPNVSPKI